MLTRRGKRAVIEDALKSSEHFTVVPVICADGTYAAKVAAIFPLKNLPDLKDKSLWNTFACFG